MIKRLFSVVLLSLLLLSLVSVATTSAAPQAGNFGLQVKPGWGAGINPTAVARYGTGGMGSPARNLAALRLRGAVGVSAPGARMLTTGTLMNSCARTPYRYFNQMLISQMLYPIGLQYSPNTITNINSLTPTYIYTKTNLNSPAVYSPTYDYRPMAIFCSGIEGIMPPYTYPNTVFWEGFSWSP
jgi:hypothetical protein